MERKLVASTGPPAANVNTRRTRSLLFFQAPRKDEGVIDEMMRNKPAAPP